MMLGSYAADAGDGTGGTRGRLGVARPRRAGERHAPLARGLAGSGAGSPRGLAGGQLAGCARTQRASASARDRSSEEAASGRNGSLASANQ